MGEVIENLDWKKEWVGMPEFKQVKKEDCYHKIIVRFDSEESIKEFSKLVEQTITNKTKSIRYPEIERGLNSNKLYEDEQES